MYLFEANSNDGFSTSEMSDDVTGIKDETLIPPPDPVLDSNPSIDSANVRSYPADGFVLNLIIFYDEHFKAKFGNKKSAISKYSKNSKIFMIDLTYCGAILEAMRLPHLVAD